MKVYGSCMLIKLFANTGHSEAECGVLGQNLPSALELWASTENPVALISS
jgi:hypothetical protein